MKRISFFAETPFSLSSNEMKHLKGGGSCGWLAENAPGSPLSVPKCGLSEGIAQAYATQAGGDWCCYDCKTRSSLLNRC